jgi:hypothetical protein
LEDVAVVLPFELGRGYPGIKAGNHTIANGSLFMRGRLTVEAKGAYRNEGRAFVYDLYNFNESSANHRGDFTEKKVGIGRWLHGDASIELWSDWVDFTLSSPGLEADRRFAPKLTLGNPQPTLGNPQPMRPPGMGHYE